MAKREWTDLDYAQAAIDMLPGSVEEIAEFLPHQKIKNQWVKNSCPIERWVMKWTETQAYAAWSAVKVEGVDIHLPEPVREYILAVDRKSL